MNNTKNSYSDLEHLELVARRIAESGVDITSNYGDWMDITFSCASLGEEAREPYHTICSQYPGYSREECDAKFDNCLRTSHGGITLGTLMKLAKDNGIDTSLPKGRRPMNEEQKRSSTKVKAELVANFLGEKSLRYDVLTQKTQQKQANGHWKEMTDREENDLYMECCSNVNENITLSLFQTVLNSNVVPEINPLKDYVESLPEWNPDMPDYIDQAASMVHMENAETDELWKRCFKKWFVNMVASWVKEEVSNHQVIVFVGKQGIYKSTWLNRLLPPQLSAYSCVQTEMEHMNKDEQLRAAEYGLINLDELDKLSDRGLNELKAQITIPHVDVRASYGRHKEKRVRVASYVGSGNKQEFLTDQTGNRRWLPFHVVSIDSPFDNELPYEGMYSQAMRLISDGFSYWFDINDVQELEGHVDEFMVPTSEEQLVQVYFSPIQAGEPGAEFLTLAEIAAKITSLGYLHKSVDLRQLGAIMTKLGFVKVRKGHSGTRGYIVLENSDIDLDNKRNPTMP